MAGRNRLEKYEKKSVCIKVYCNEMQRIQIKNNADGEPLSYFLLRCALSKKNVFQKLDPELIKLKVQLMKLGNNLNQLTRVANSKREIDDKKELLSVLNSLKLLMNTILDALP